MQRIQLEAEVLANAVEFLGQVASQGRLGDSAF